MQEKADILKPSSPNDSFVFDMSCSGLCVFSHRPARSQKTANYSKCFYLAQYIASQTYSLLIVQNEMCPFSCETQKKGCKTESGEGGVFHY